MSTNDTHPKIQQMLDEMLRQTPVWRKIEMLGHLNTTARQLALGGLRERYPQANEAELRRRLADLLLGPELALRAYGPLNSPHHDKS